MRSIPAFSKKPSNGPTVGGGGKRSGFTDHVKCTYADKPKAVPHMAATYPIKSTTTHTSGKTKAPSFKSGSGQAARSVPAFSKKRV